MPEQKEVIELLHRDWGLSLPEVVSEEDILSALERRVLEYADKNPEQFFQLMYRLDIPERKVRAVLFEQDAPRQIAQLIYKRQLQKIEARRSFRQGDGEIDEDLKW